MPNASYRTLDTEVLIVGGGLAALRAALAARSAGARVLMLAKRLIGRSGSSTMTTGGYAAAVQNLNSRDSAELHYIDTIAGGGYVNERKLVRALVDDAPARLRELWDYGVQFRKRNGQYHLSPSGDHTQARVFVPEHMRGIDLTLPLRQAVLDAGVDVLEDFMALDLLREEDRVVGAVALGRVKGEAVIVNAKATVLAAGGAGRLFTITSNPVDVCGSGYALALRAGARLRDMEFIQFYPWRLIQPFKSTRVPIQPSTFMMGARLYNSRGERFMEKYDPIKKESQPAMFQRAASRIKSAKGWRSTVAWCSTCRTYRKTNFVTKILRSLICSIRRRSTTARFRLWSRQRRISSWAASRSTTADAPAYAGSTPQARVRAACMAAIASTVIPYPKRRCSVIAPD